jgi:diguanylate cyclase (GGDEF)-like protein
MADGQTKMLLNGGAMVSGGVARRNAPRTARDVRRELEALRCTNTQLLRELAVLRAREAETQRLADRDGLTGLYNRRRMLEMLDAAIVEAQQRWQCVGLLFIDLNGFKGINDEYGHGAGDKILTSVATRIAGRVRNGDIVCRYGGDEFVVILPTVPNAASVSRVAETIRERVALPYWINGDEQHLSAAIGESIYPHDGENAAVLLHRADQAMYRVKTRMARPMLTLASTPFERPSRRRNDKTKGRSSGQLIGGDM